MSGQALEQITPLEVPSNTAGETLSDDAGTRPQDTPASPEVAAVFARIRRQYAERAGLGPDATVEQSLDALRQRRAQALGLEARTASWHDILDEDALPLLLTGRVAYIVKAVSRYPFANMLDSFMCYVAERAEMLNASGRVAEANKLLEVWDKVREIEPALRAKLPYRKNI